ncbi:hypothetical protein KY362_04415, partial [Candidatus Woesearchaeota archaeon]|nr:hypothetical protein [Candidatus Woesearchaeota archaeon]
TCSFNETGFLTRLVFKDGSSEVAASNTFQFDFGGGPWTETGYSVLEDSGSSMGAARVLYYINNTNASYYTIVEFTLESNRDFLQVRIR